MDFQRLFPRLLSSNRLSHGYLFYGPDRVSASAVAISLSHFLEKGEWSQKSAALADCLELSSPVRVIGVDDVRYLRRFLFIHPLVSRRRLAIIHDADQLTPEAQNALLKISEDTPPSALIILIAVSRETLLPTIVSRFQSIFFPDRNAAPAGSPAAADLSAAKKFLSADAAGRRLLIKNITDQERASRAADKSDDSPSKESSNTIRRFLDALSFILASSINKTPAGPARARRATATRRILSLSANLNEFELNRRLALEALAVALPRLSVV